eukprot:6208552-Pyramimonas_sp.AAC.1
MLSLRNVHHRRVSALCHPRPNAHVTLELTPSLNAPPRLARGSTKARRWQPTAYSLSGGRFSSCCSTTTGGRDFLRATRRRRREVKGRGRSRDRSRWWV